MYNLKNKIRLISVLFLTIFVTSCSDNEELDLKQDSVEIEIKNQYLDLLYNAQIDKGLLKIEILNNNSSKVQYVQLDLGKKEFRLNISSSLEI